MKTNTIGTIVVATFLLFGGLDANAAHNALSAIQINPDGSSYKIVLKSDAATEYKKNIESPNRMSLELKNISMPTSVNTIYNNVPDVDNVIIQPLSKNSIRIILQGDNIAKSKIAFETWTSPINSLNPISSPTNEIEINKPMKLYEPIWKEEPAENENEMSISGVMSTISGSNSIQGILSKIKNKINLQSIMYILGGLLIFFFGLRLFSNNAESKRDITVGLSRSLREKPLSQSVDATIDDDIEFTQRPSSRFKNNANYGLKRYQQSEKSPYVSTSTFSSKNQPSRRKFQPSPAQQARTQMQTEAKSTTTVQQRTQTKQLKSAFTNPEMMKKPSISLPQSEPQTEVQGGIDSIKFLESMTKIYEKNGRGDLAAGLKNNLKKVQIAQPRI